MERPAMHMVFVSLFSFNLMSCGQNAEIRSTSTIQDIYNNDLKTRRPAIATELAWTVYMAGCTGSMLSPRLLLTANHCNPSTGRRYTSGAAYAAGKSQDLEAVKVVERSTYYDYAIVEVKWLSETFQKTQRYSPYIQTAPNVLQLGDDSDQETKLFTVGFPTDKGLKPMHAVGYAKRYNEKSLYYNIGSINGNSGGAVWRSDNMMLVSQTNFGKHKYGQAGWNNNDPENANTWNGGGRMDKIYAQSVVLKSVFPAGDNRYADGQGRLQ